MRRASLRPRSALAYLFRYVQDFAAGRLALHQNLALPKAFVVPPFSPGLSFQICPGLRCGAPSAASKSGLAKSLCLLRRASLCPRSATACLFRYVQDFAAGRLALQQNLALPKACVFCTALRCVLRSTLAYLPRKPLIKAGFCASLRCVLARPSPIFKICLGPLRNASLASPVVRIVLH